MNLYLVRHAAAVEQNREISETNRYLTMEGRLSFRKVVKQAAKKGLVAELILTSPLVRSVQTADILAETIKYKGSVQVAPELSPGFNRKQLEHLLERWGKVQDLVLVGHEPDLSEQVAGLLTIPALFGLKKGAIVALTLDRQQGDRALFNWLASNGKFITSAIKAFPVD